MARGATCGSCLFVFSRRGRKLDSESSNVFCRDLLFVARVVMPRKRRRQYPHPYPSVPLFEHPILPDTRTLSSISPLGTYVIGNRKFSATPVH